MNHVRRVYFAGQRRRRRIGRLVALVGCALAGGVLTLAANGMIAGAASAGLVIALAIGLTAWGFRLATEKRSFVDVDPVARSAAFTVDGVGAEPVALETLAPLVAAYRTTEILSGSDEGGRVVTDVVLHPAGREYAVLAELRTPREARRRLRALAREWSLASRFLSGDVIAASDLGRPLHERLGDDPDARRSVPLEPGWGISIASEPAGRVVRSTHRGWDASWLFLLVPLPILYAMVQLDLLRGMGDPAGDPAPLVVFGSLALVAAGALAKGLAPLRDRLAPGALRIGSDGVEFRGQRLALAEVEEVVVGAGVEILGAARSIHLPATFAPGDSLVLLRHEIQRLIIEAASR